jgi:RNA polymerase-binding transcription factor DksA
MVAKKPPGNGRAKTPRIPRGGAAEYWTDERLAAARQQLRERADTLRQDIVRELRKYDDDRYGVLADNVADSAESSVADLLVDVDLAEIDRDLTELRAVEAALRRTQDGTYGVCADCGGAIDAVRLHYTPHAARCVPCQERFERMQATPAPARL